MVFLPLKFTHLLREDIVPNETRQFLVNWISDDMAVLLSISCPNLNGGVFVVRRGFVWVVLFVPKRSTSTQPMRLVPLKPNRKYDLIVRI